MDTNAFSTFAKTDIDSFYAENIFHLERGNRFYCLLYIGPLNAPPDWAMNPEETIFFEDLKILRGRDASPGTEIANEGGYDFILVDRVQKAFMSLFKEQFDKLQLPESFFLQLAVVNTRGKTIANNKEEKEIMLENANSALVRIKNNCLISELKECNQPFQLSDYDFLLKRLIRQLFKARAPRLDL